MAEKEKPLKTALVREDRGKIINTPEDRYKPRQSTERFRSSLAESYKAGRARGRLGAEEQNRLRKAFIHSGPRGTKLPTPTAEAQAFVGQMKPGVELRTIKHSAHDWADGMEIRRDIEMERPGPVRPGDNWGHTRKYVPDVAEDLGEKPFNVTSTKKSDLYIPTKDQAAGARMHANVTRLSNMENKFFGNEANASFEGSGTETGSTKAQGLKHRALTRALRDRRSAMRGDPQKANAVQALSAEEKSAVDAASKAEVERTRTAAKVSKEAAVKARTITDEELFSGQSRVPIGQGKKDLGRSVTRTIRGGTEGDAELLRIAQRRSIAGRSIAGPDPAKPPTMAQRAKAARAKNVQAQKAYNKATGIAPIVDLHSRNKGWDKIKAIEPGELPDLD